jgi:rhodanese-related sulfurtransferase
MPMQQVKVTEVTALLRQLADQGAAPLVLDVREPWELQLAALALPGIETLNLPMMSVPQRLAELDPARPILGLCHHGMRSAQVLHFLSQQGYTALYNISGGIHAWAAEVDPAVPVY